MSLKWALALAIMLLAAVAVGWMWKLRAVKTIKSVANRESSQGEVGLFTDISSAAASTEASTFTEAPTAQKTSIRAGKGRTECRVKFAPERNQIVNVPRLQYYDDDHYDNDDHAADLPSVPSVPSVPVEMNEEEDLDSDSQVSADLELVNTHRGADPYSDHEFNARRDAEIEKAKMEHAIEQRKHQFELVDETIAELDMVSDHEIESSRRFEKDHQISTRNMMMKQGVASE